MDGYFRNDAASAQVLKDGWLSTGDLGFIADGTLFIVAAQEMVIKAGRNLYPYDVERVVGELAAFAWAASPPSDARTRAPAPTTWWWWPRPARRSTGREALTRAIRGESWRCSGRVDDVRLWPSARSAHLQRKIRRKECARLVTEAGTREACARHRCTGSSA